MSVSWAAPAGQTVKLTHLEHCKVDMLSQGTANPYAIKSTYFEFSSELELSEGHQCKDRYDTFMMKQVKTLFKIIFFYLVTQN